MRLPGFSVSGIAQAALAACTGPRTEAPPGIPAALPVEAYRQAAGRGEPVYRIDAAESLVTVRVYRDGPLARLGHDHVVASHDVSGFAVWSEDEAIVPRADLRMPIRTLTVDEAQLRAEAGFASEPGEGDIAGTRKNMLASVEAAAFPVIDVHVTLAIRAPQPRLDVAVNWHGMTQHFDVPVELHADGDRLEAVGSFSLRQTQFGITPYSVFGGALSVADELRVFFRLSGRPVRTGDPDFDAART